MATDVDQSCYGWSRDELDDQDDSREISISQMLDHGSISFGRFALEPLSWEKRSVFTHNRYQEELESFTGLVAQKKAYFEEYYKRIRVMKLLQENQHTEPASHCGDSRDISVHMRDDQKIVPGESDRDEIIKNIGPVEKSSIEVALDVDGEIVLVGLDSPATLSEDNKNGEAPSNAKHRQILDINSYHHESITEVRVDSEQLGFIRVDDKLEPLGIKSESFSRQIGIENQRVIGDESHGDDLEYVTGSDREKTYIEMPLGVDAGKPSDNDKLCESSQNPKLFQFLDQNSSNHEPIIASIEDSKQSQDDEEVSKKSEKYVPNDSFYSSCSLTVLEDKLNAKQKKFNQVKELKANALSSVVMQHSSTTGDFVKSELKTKSVTVLLPKSLRDSSQKRNGKNNVCIVSNKQTVGRILSSEHATVASHRSNKEWHSKVTTPRPFSFATGKKAVGSISGASEGHDAKNIFSSSSLAPNNINSKCVSKSRPRMPSCSPKREKLESISGHEPRRQPLVASRQAAYFKGVSASNMIGPLKARSVNLPPSRKVDTNFGTNSNRCTLNNKDGKRTVNDETCLKGVVPHEKSTIFYAMSGNQNPNNMKMAPSKIRDLSVNKKNSQFGDDSLDRRKPRLEKPRWR